MKNPYDILPYTDHAYAESHPDNLRVVAELSGFAHAAPERPRVLELGCGRGGNLLPLASAWPDGSFVGVDRSSSQIQEASRVAKAAQLRNVSFITADFTVVALPAESFDFVLCHGVYSWVTVEARRALLARIRSSLAEGGVAYVSFNTLPGWYRKLAARDWLRFVGDASTAHDPRDKHELREPRGALEWLRRVVSPEHAGYRADLDAVRERIAATDVAYAVHEFLAEEHHPVYVTTFLAEAAEAGLAYVGDALPGETALELSPEAVRERARGLDVANAQVLVDFTRETAFRRAVLVRADTATQRRFRAPQELDPQALTRLRIASRLTPADDAGASDLESFVGAAVTIQASGAARRALHALAKAAPASIAHGELATLVEASSASLAEELFDLWLVAPGLDLHAREPALVTSVSLRPRACPVARARALSGGPVTNVWHQEVLLPETVVRFVLSRLDGTATALDLTRAVAERSDTLLDPDEAAAIVHASLSLLARSALLIA